MLFGPTFSLEVVTGSRRKRLFFVRTAYVVILLFVLWVQYANLRTWQTNVSLQATANLAYSFFSAFAWVQLLAVVLITPAVIAGAISQEYERRTIEYLFTSQLSNSEIVLGKLSARFLTVSAHLLAGLPLLALARMLGGIPLESLLAVFAVTFLALVGVASLSIAVSVFARRSRDALGRVYAILFMLLLVPLLVMGFGMSGARVENVPLAVLINGFLDWVYWANGGLLSVHPFLVQAVALEGTAPPIGFTGGLGEALSRMAVVYSILSAACVAVAVASVRRRYLRQVGAADAPRRRSWWWRRRRAVGNYPMIWKETVAEPAFARLGIAGKIAVILIVGSVLIPTIGVFTDVFRTGWNSEDYIFFTTWMASLVGCGSLLLILGRAAGSITGEKERETWSTLLSTTLTPFEILAGKFFGAVYAIRWVFAMVTLLWGLAIVVEPVILPGVAVVGAALAVLTSAAIAIGLVWSLGSKTSLRAMVGAMATGVFLGGGYLLCCSPVMFLGSSGAAFVLAPCVPFLLGYPVPAWWAVMESSWNSSSEFAEMAFAWVVGGAGYLALAVMLSSYAVSNFDSVTGRITPRLNPPTVPRRPNDSDSTG